VQDVAELDASIGGQPVITADTLRLLAETGDLKRRRKKYYEYMPVSRKQILTLWVLIQQNMYVRWVKGSSVFYDSHVSRYTVEFSCCIIIVTRNITSESRSLNCSKRVEN
jgi:hypothetical protein